MLESTKHPPRPANCDITSIGARPRIRVDLLLHWLDYFAFRYVPFEGWVAVLLAPCLVTATSILITRAAIADACRLAIATTWRAADAI